MSRRSSLTADEYLLSVIMPVYNEEERLEEAVRQVRAVEELSAETIAVDDHSQDESWAILKRLHQDGQVDRIFRHDQNQGKGQAVRTAIPHARGDITVIQDADLEYTPEDLPDLLEPLLDGRADAVIGSRFLGGGPHRVLYFWHYLGNKILTLLSNAFTDLNLTDMEVCYKAIRTDLLQQLPLTSQRFGLEPELVARLSQADARIYEVPIRYAGRTYEEGKKITWKDGLAALWHIPRFSLFPPRARPHQLPSLVKKVRTTAEENQ